MLWIINTQVKKITQVNIFPKKALVKHYRPKVKKISEIKI